MSPNPIHAKICHDSTLLARSFARGAPTTPTWSTGRNLRSHGVTRRTQAARGATLTRFCENSLQGAEAPCGLRSQLVISCPPMNTLMRALLITTVGCVGDVASNPGVDAGMGETAPPDAAGACGNVMTSHDNCGACGHACNSVESCTGGKCGDSSEELVDVSAGEDSVCVVTRGGKVFCWGGNSLGELGVDSGTSQCAGAEPCSPTPLEVKGISDAVHVSVGDRHACALRASRTVVCWGRNDLGQLGHASSLDGLCSGTPCGRVPVEVASLSDVDGVSAFGTDTCAITRGGAVLCWGKAVSPQHPLPRR